MAELGLAILRPGRVQRSIRAGVWTALGIARHSSTLPRPIGGVGKPARDHQCSVPRKPLPSPVPCAALLEIPTSHPLRRKS
jgi:hypothetical protein